VAIPLQTPPGGVGLGLQVWLRAGLGISAANGANVLLWQDQSDHGVNAAWNPSNAFGELPPVFEGSNPGVRGAPTVRFNGASALEIDLTWLAGSDYTVMVVNGRDRFGLANFYIAGDVIGDNQNLVLGYERTDLLRQAHFNNDLDAVVEDYTGTEVWSLDTYRFAQAEGRDLYHNGTRVGTDDNGIALLSNPGSTLGHFRALPAFWFEGDLAEVVVYDRALTADERLLIEADLAGRYGRPLRLEDYAPCTALWGSHGAYVSAHAHVVNVFVQYGVLSSTEGGQAKAAAAASGCGN
jgi:hypothetical protein